MTVFETLKEKYFKDADTLARFLLNRDAIFASVHCVKAGCFYMSMPTGHFTCYGTRG